MDAHIYGDNNCVDFEADTVHKAILKLHRLNRLQHRSGDDWAMNMLEATADLVNDQDQAEFIKYLANPSGYKQHKELWDNLEIWDKENTPTAIQKEVAPDGFNPDFYTENGTQVGTTKYIHVKNNTGTIYEDDEKIEPSPEQVNFTIDCEEEKTVF